MKQVTGSLTGEATSEEFLMEMPKIKNLDRKSAYDRIEDALRSYKKMHKEKPYKKKI